MKLRTFWLIHQRELFSLQPGTHLPTVTVKILVLKLASLDHDAFASTEKRNIHPIDAGFEASHK